MRTGAGIVGVGDRGWDRCGRGRTASMFMPDGSRTPSHSPFVATSTTPQFPTDQRVVDARDIAAWEYTKGAHPLSWGIVDAQGWGDRLPRRG